MGLEWIEIDRINRNNNLHLSNGYVSVDTAQHAVSLQCCQITLLAMNMNNTEERDSIITFPVLLGFSRLRGMALTLGTVWPSVIQSGHFWHTHMDWEYLGGEEISVVEMQLLSSNARRNFTPNSDLFSKGNQELKFLTGSRLEIPLSAWNVLLS